MNKKISVALCTYNGELFIREQLDSILNQTVKVDEIVICDDCSKDTTASILEVYKNNYPDIVKVFYNAENLKSNKNFEKAISLCQGEYIFLSDQDDVWKPEKVAKILAVFNKNPKAEGVFSNADFINDKGETIYNGLTLWEFVCFFENENHNPDHLIHLLTHKGNFLTGATLCIKNTVKETCIPFKTGPEFIHDEWLAFYLSHKKTLYYSRENLISYRIHKNQQLGVGNIAETSRIKKENFHCYNLILENIKPKSFKDYKIKTRAYFFQFDKYKNLFLIHNDPIFLEVKNKILNKYLEDDNKMKRHNPILYFFRKQKDKRKGKRQLPE